MNNKKLNNSVANEDNYILSYKKEEINNANNEGLDFFELDILEDRGRTLISEWKNDLKIFSHPIEVQSVMFDVQDS